ncbi:MAG: hypothetical protein LRZ85_09340 [Alphaproteobacteria bacterium]|nr:hypothetical protein [Alphaproteobacteria bacterium]MCD8520419.1 hypothetical protein [Alphaproteobacteria bacterium]
MTDTCYQADMEQHFGVIQDLLVTPFQEQSQPRRCTPTRMRQLGHGNAYSYSEFSDSLHMGTRAFAAGEQPISLEYTQHWTEEDHMTARYLYRATGVSLAKPLPGMNPAADREYQANLDKPILSLGGLQYRTDIKQEICDKITESLLFIHQHPEEAEKYINQHPDTQKEKEQILNLVRASDRFLTELEYKFGHKTRPEQVPDIELLHEKSLKQIRPDIPTMNPY